jgi:hypothetical protein
LSSKEDLERRIAVAALYRIPPVPPPNRAIEFTDGRLPSVLDAGWRGERAVACSFRGFSELRPASRKSSAGGLELQVVDFEGDLPFGPAGFDLAILHRTLDHLRARAASTGRDIDALTLLARVLPLLSPGGIVAGCVRNRFTLGTHATRPANGGAGSQPDGDRHVPGWLSVPACRDLLVRAGLSEINLYGLYPDEFRPVNVRNLDADAFAWTSARSVDERRATLGLGGYLARRAYAATGLSRFVPPVIFFWGSKR